MIQRDRLLQEIDCKSTPRRTYRILQSMGIKKYRHLVLLTKGELLRQQGFGRSSLNWIEKDLKEHSLELSMTIKEVDEIIYPTLTEPKSDIDWEQRRYEIAKALMSSERIEDYGYNLQKKAQSCIEIADELIKQLKK